MSGNRKQICDILVTVISHHDGRNIPLYKVDSIKELKDLAITKSMQKFQTQETVVKRIQKFGKEEDLDVKKILREPAEILTMYRDNVIDKTPFESFEFVKVQRYLKRSDKVLIMRKKTDG